MDARIAHVRELKDQVRRLRAENDSLRRDNEALLHHMSMAVLAAEDMRDLPEGGHLCIWDGWNLILGSDREASSPRELVAQARRYLEENALDRVWIVFDGPKENSSVEGRLRISYTGGVGLHRADKLVCDFIRMARFCGKAARIVVKTSDKDFKRDVDRLLGDLT